MLGAFQATGFQYSGFQIEASKSGGRSKHWAAKRKVEDEIILAFIQAFMTTD